LRELIEKGPNYSNLLGDEGDGDTDRTSGRKPSESIWGGVAAMREQSTIKVDFTPREFPTPARESKTHEESEVRRLLLLKLLLFYNLQYTTIIHPISGLTRITYQLKSKEGVFPAFLNGIGTHFVKIHGSFADSFIIPERHPCNKNSPRAKLQKHTRKES